MVGELKRSACLNDTILAGLVDGTLGADDRSVIDVHIDHCAACRQVVAGLGRRETLEATANERPARAPRGTGPPPAQPTRIDRYVVKRVLGAGAMGTVYLAKDPTLDRRIAIKVLRHAETSGSQTRLLREAQALARVDHANVVAVYDVGEHDHQVFIAMEYVAGGNLRTWLQTMRSWRAIANAFVAAGRGLAAVHDAGLIHRDFKPDNVLLGEDGSVHVGDFGLVAAEDFVPEGSLTRISELDLSLTATGSVVGTPAYMAPEQFLGQHIDARSDQFAFCVTLFEALYRSRPFVGTDIAALGRAVVAGAVKSVPRSNVPGRLHALVLRGLSPDPAERFPSMTALVAELERILRRRRKQLWIAGGAASSLAIAAVTWTVATRTTPSAQPSVCAGVEAELAGIWDPRIRAAAEQRFAASPVPYARETWTRLGSSLDDYARRWSAGRRAACEDTEVRRVQSDAMKAVRMDCLTERKGRLRVLTHVLADQAGGPLEPSVIQASLELAATLPPLEACDRVGEAEPAKLPPAAQWAKVQPVREQLQALEAAIALEDPEATADRARGLIAQADAVGFAPLQGRARLLLGHILLDESDQAIPVLREAVQFADQGRDDETRVTALARLTTASLGDLDRKAARVTLETWRSALIRTGSDPESDTEFISIRALIAILDGDIKTGERDLRRLEQALISEPTDFIANATRLQMLGSAATEYMAPADQLAFDQRLFMTCQEKLGPTHPTTLEAKELVGAALYYAHRFDEAERTFDELREYVGQPGYELSEFRVAVAAIYRETGRYVESEQMLDQEASHSDRDEGELAFERGLLAVEREQLPKARKLLEQAYAEGLKWVPEDHPFLAQMWSARAGVERRLGRPNLAIEYARKAEHILTKKLAGESHRYAEALAELGLGAAALHQDTVAIEALEGCLRIVDRSTLLARQRAEVRLALAQLVQRRDPTRAKDLVTAATKDLEHAPGEYAKRLASEAAKRLARLAPVR